ncbi:MAG TPA: glutathione S-transferase family protein [Stellaceae bacterium]|nr:glutathione S-transferase family protein [Stellaceae bacterium]
MTITLYELAGAEPDRRFSPYCWRIRMALAHKELPAEGIPWRFTEKETLAPTGQGRVPVIVDKGRWVNDSCAIANYLEDTYPDRPSLFGGEAGRAATRFVQGWTDTVLHPGLLRSVVLDIWRHADEKDKAYFRKSREERFGGVTLEALQSDREERLPALRQTLQPLRNMLEAQPFIGGGKPLYADYTVFGAFQWVRCISPFKFIERDDPVYAWRERMLGLFGGMARESKGYPV